jgi:hypothetical protein
MKRAIWRVSASLPLRYDVLKGVQCLGPATEQHLAAFAGQVDPDTVGRVGHVHGEGQAHSVERAADEVFHAAVQVHYLRSLAASLFPPPAFFSRRSAAGRMDR